MRAFTLCQRPSIAGPVVRAGIEPAPFCFSGRRSYQLSYLTSTVEFCYLNYVRSPVATGYRDGRPFTCTSPESGWPDSNRRPLRPERSALDQAALQPDAAPGQCRDFTALATCKLLPSCGFRLRLLGKRGRLHPGDPRVEREAPLAGVLVSRPYPEPCTEHLSWYRRASLPAPGTPAPAGSGSPEGAFTQHGSFPCAHSHRVPHPGRPTQGSSRPTVVSLVGTAGFEPTTSCAPRTRASQAAPCPVKRGPGVRADTDPSAPGGFPGSPAWSGRSGSNRRPPGPRPGALPTALRPVSNALCQPNTCRC